MKFFLSNNRIRSLLIKHLNCKKADKKSVLECKKWLERQAEELNRQEKKGKMLDVWLADIIKYYPLGMRMITFTSTSF